MGHRQQSSWFHGKHCYTIPITPDLLFQGASFALIIEDCSGSILPQDNFDLFQWTDGLLVQLSYSAFQGNYLSC